MPHDSFASNPAEPVLVSLTVPVATRDSLVDDLVRPLSPAADAPVLDADAADAEVAEFLVRAAHSEGGFVARTVSGERALGVLAATVAALCGEDIRCALTRPDLEFLRGLRPEAVTAVRTVLLAIESDTPQAVGAVLEVLRTRA